MTSSSQPDRVLRVLISAGEASGEMYGAGLLEALRRKSSAPVECFGVGGERMRDAGCETVVDARDVAVVGLFEVIRHLPGIYREFHKLLREVDQRRPDVAVLIDFPDFNFRLAKELHRRGIPVVYYVSPQLWAWRRGRIELVKKYVREMLVIFPFEQEFYAGHGVEVEFVGHPLGRVERPEVSREAFAREYGLNPDKTWIALLPGSRRGEVERHAEELARLPKLAGPEYEFIVPVANTLSRQWVQQLFRRGPQHPRPKYVFVDDARLALAVSRAAVVASGTATVEAAVIGTPFVMIYRVAPLTYSLGKRLVKVPFYGMPNLIAGRQVVPELVQHDFTAENVFNELRKILPDGAERKAMLEGLAEVRDKLRGSAEVSPDDAAALAVMSVLG